MCSTWLFIVVLFFFQAEDGIRDLVRSRGLGDVYKRQGWLLSGYDDGAWAGVRLVERSLATLVAPSGPPVRLSLIHILTLPTSDLV